MSNQNDTQLSLNLGNEFRKADEIFAPDSEITLFRDFLSKEESGSLFKQLLNEVEWSQDEINCYGKKVKLPRLTAWYGDFGKKYTYSGIAMEPIPWTPELFSLKIKAEMVAKSSFNSVLLNLYRNGKDSISWHSDNEPELGECPVIGSLSLGGQRKFRLRHKFKKEMEVLEINLTDGSFLIMKGKTQECWQHQVPKTVKTATQRINLTFRFIK